MFAPQLKQTLEVHAGFVAPLMRQGLYGVSSLTQ